MSLPNINFLHITVSDIQPGQTISRRPPTHPDTMGENNTPTALKGCGVKMGVTLGEKATILDKIQELAYSWSEESYQSKYDSLCEVMPNIVRTYYDRNWHPIRHEWVDSLKHTMNPCTSEWNRLNFIGRLFVHFSDR